jgi:hypothetical protein
VVIDPPPIMPLGANGGNDTNPVYIHLSASPQDYGQVFEAILQTLGDFGFEVAVGDSNRYGGRIEALPRTSPGLGLLLKPGSPDLYFRLLSTTQSYRHRVTVLIQPVEKGGYFVEFIARKELEDLPRPLRASVGAAVLRSENTVERQFEVIDATFFEPNWIYKGRDAALEQEFIRKLKDALCGPQSLRHEWVQRFRHSLDHGPP